MEMFGKQESGECRSLKEAILGMYGICLELKFHMKSGCGSMNNIVFKICQEKQVFSCYENSCCSCIIFLVSTKIFPIQPMMEALEGSGKD